MTDRRSTSSDNYEGAIIEEAHVAVKGSSKPMSPKTTKQLSSSAEAAKKARTLKAEEAIEKAVKAEFFGPEDKGKNAG